MKAEMKIVKTIRALGGEASRSSVGRHVAATREKMERYNQAREMARAWGAHMKEQPDGDVGRLLSEMLRTVAWQQIGTMDTDAGVDSSEIMVLARALKDLASADKLAMERELRIRKEVALLAADAAAVASADAAAVVST